MPELPDVELFRRLVLDRCRDRLIDRVTISDRGILEGIAADAFERRLAGEPIRSSARHGKHLFAVLGDAGALAMHFGTNGSLQLVERAVAEPAYTRLQLHFADGERLAYVNPRRLGRISLCDSAAAYVAAAGLGPDALDPGLDLAAFTAILGRRRRDIKAVLMDQQLIAGIGNIYSDEILFQAGLPPAAAAADLSDAGIARLYRAMRDTLETAIRCGAGAEQAAGPLPKDFLLPHRHKGGSCPRCGTALAVLKRGGRTGYYCPRCQRG